MHTVSLWLDAAWRVLLAGLVLGAGLPAIFAVGIRSLAVGAGDEAPGARPAPHAAGRALAVLCFAIVLAVVALGIALIVAGGFGKHLSFEHVYPTVVDKK